MDSIRWGIVGPGRIAGKFAAALAAVDGAELSAVASRSPERARGFADAHGARHDFDSYEALAASDTIEAVYVATPHPQHARPVRLCLEHGKAVLCEKPFTVSAAELEPLVALAREKGLFLMEAMWSRFLPVMAVVREWIDDGRIGEPRMVQATFGFRSEWNPEGRLLNPELAGGALLDVGVYTVSFSNWVFGAVPVAVAGLATLGETGVDEQMAAALQYPNGGLGCVMAAVRTDLARTATIYGTEGHIRVGPPFWRATEATLQAGGEDRTESRPFRANGFEFEIMEVGRCLREGLTESPVLPLDDSLGVMRTLDALRAQWGLRYPFE